MLGLVAHSHLFDFNPITAFFSFIFVLAIVDHAQMEQIAMAHWDKVPQRPTQRFGLSAAAPLASQLRFFPSIFHDVYPALCPLGKDQGNVH